MKKLKFLGLVAASALIAEMSLIAAETGTGIDWLKISNRLRLEYDDNVYERETDKVDSFKIIEEIELGMTFDWEPTFLTLKYRPAFSWWSDREPDDTDVHHDFDVVLNHKFSPRASMGLKNSLRLAEQPEEIDRGVTLRENDDYLYNVTDGNLDFAVAPRTHLVLGGRYTILQYDRDDVAVTEDYDIWAAGATLRYRLTDFTQVMADYRRESISYDLEDRGSDSDFIGLGLENVIGASWVSAIRAGYQSKDFKDDGLEDQDDPYGDASITYILSPRTRLSAGAGYSMFEADVFPYASQNRTIMFVSAAHDFTARLALYLSGSYQMSEYLADSAISEADFPAASGGGGDEDVWQGSARLAYQLNARNSLELNYQYISLDSDLREDFDRNRVSIGWRLDI